MDFYINKCSTPHVGRRNTGNRYTLGGVDIGKSNSEKRPEVYRTVYQCKEHSEQGVGFYHQSVSNGSADVILRFYLALVRPHLGYGVQFWSLFYRTDIDKLEST